jgi:serpin B
MVLSGAANDTASELKTLLDLNNLSDEEILTMNNDYLTKLSNLNNGQVTIKTANKIYSHNDFEFKKEFVENLTKYFMSSIEPLNFEDSNRSSKKINNWVSKETNNRIKNIISPQSLSISSKMILINAIYFKTRWLDIFKVEDTQESDFYTNNNGGTVKVNMMNMSNCFLIGRTINGLKAKTCNLPYKCCSLSMTIILPDKDSSLEEVNESLKFIGLNSVLNAANEYKKVNLSLPKFKMEFKSEVIDSNLINKYNIFYFFLFFLRF